MLCWLESRSGPHSCVLSVGRMCVCVHVFWCVNSQYVRVCQQFSCSCLQDFLHCTNVKQFNGLRTVCSCIRINVLQECVWALIWVGVISGWLAAAVLTSWRAPRSNKLARICPWLTLSLQSVKCQFTAHSQQTLGLYYMAQWRNTWKKLQRAYVPICTSNFQFFKRFSAIAALFLDTLLCKAKVLNLTCSEPRPQFCMCSRTKASDASLN